MSNLSGQIDALYSQKTIKELGLNKSNRANKSKGSLKRMTTEDEMADIFSEEVKR
jgi:hypothetical protein